MPAIAPQCQFRQPQQPKQPQSRLSKSLKQLEARRLARIKTVGARLVKTLKTADLQARELLVEDLQDVATAAADALQEPADTSAEEQMRT